VTQATCNHAQQTASEVAFSLLFLETSRFGSSS